MRIYIFIDKIATQPINYNLYDIIYVAIQGCPLSNFIPTSKPSLRWETWVLVFSFSNLSGALENESKHQPLEADILMHTWFGITD